MTRTTLALAATMFFSVHSVSLGQVVLQDSLDSETGWSIAHLPTAASAASPSDNYYEFGYDYSAYGIPEAPNSQGGDPATSGLRMIVNRDNGVANAMSAFPTGQSYSGQYTLQFDLWINAVGPFPAGGTGSTEFGGGFIGFDPNDGIAFSGGGLVVSGEAGSSFDYRLYADDERQNFTTHLFPASITGDYNADRAVNIADYTVWRDALGSPVIAPGTGSDGDLSGVIDPGDYTVWKENFGDFQVNDLYGPRMETDNGNTNTYVEGIFPGVEAPAAQQALAAPIDQSGTTLDAAIAFQWVTFKYTVDTVAGTVLVQMTNPTTGETADIGTFTYENTYVDQSTIDDKILTSFEGNIALTYFDPFSSIVDDQYVDLSFGLFDNVIVEQMASTGAVVANIPEPSTVMLIALSIVGLGAIRNRM